MLIEKSAGVVVFRKEGGRRYYLLLHYGPDARRNNSFWDFSKGHIEKGEDDLMAAKREVFEETGINDLNIIKGFREKIRYFFVIKERKISKTVVYFLGETKKSDVEISFEHTGFKWLEYSEAFLSLSFQNSKNILKKADKYLNEF